MYQDISSVCFIRVKYISTDDSKMSLVYSLMASNWFVFTPCTTLAVLVEYFWGVPEGNVFCSNSSLEIAPDLYAIISLEISSCESLNWLIPLILVIDIGLLVSIRSAMLLSERSIQLWMFSNSVVNSLKQLPNCSPAIWPTVNVNIFWKM